MNNPSSLKAETNIHLTKRARQQARLTYHKPIQYTSDDKSNMLAGVHVWQMNVICHTDRCGRCYSFVVRFSDYKLYYIVLNFDF